MPFKVKDKKLAELGKALLLLGGPAGFNLRGFKVNKVGSLIRRKEVETTFGVNTGLAGRSRSGKDLFDIPSAEVKKSKVSKEFMEQILELLSTRTEKNLKEIKRLRSKN